MCFNKRHYALITDDKINELIKIGKLYSDKNIDYLQNNIKTISIIFDQNIQYNLHKFFSNSSRGYSKNDLSYIFIGIVVGEIFLRGGPVLNGGGYGSVTATTKIYHLLEKDYPLRAEVMKQWSKQFGFTNGYFYSI